MGEVNRIKAAHTVRRGGGFFSFRFAIIPKSVVSTLVGESVGKYRGHTFCAVRAIPQ